MVQRNQHLAKLQAGYLFPEIGRRKAQFLALNPQAKLISLGIGDTTLPLLPPIASAMEAYSKALSTPHGYSGYGASEGVLALREAIATRIYHSKVSADEVFVSDGAKCDMGRLQLLFPSNAKIAVQDPAYPVYVDTSVMVGRTGQKASFGGYENIVYLPCTPENNFFPDIDKVEKADLYCICSPNNPTGVALPKEILEKLVKKAKETKSFILFDAAYAGYIQDSSIPKSIYEIDGADEVAIEIGSFSKLAGFTGVRLGWVTIPKKLHFDDGSPLHKDWTRITNTFFNGASNIVQAGGIAALKEDNWNEVQNQIAYYLENAKILRSTLESQGIRVFGGKDAPFLWADFKKDSWQVFEDLMQQAHIVTTPGSGFGPAGEGFLRLSALGKREDVLEAANRLKQFLNSR